MATKFPRRPDGVLNGWLNGIGDQNEPFRTQSGRQSSLAVALVLLFKVTLGLSNVCFEEALKRKHKYERKELYST